MLLLWVFRKRRLQPNPRNTEEETFNLKNKLANMELNVRTTQRNNKFLKYLGALMTAHFPSENTWNTWLENSEHETT